MILHLNQRSQILVTFRPTLLDQAIKEESKHLVQQDMSLCEEELDKKKLDLKVSIISWYNMSFFFLLINSLKDDKCFYKGIFFTN